MVHIRGVPDTGVSEDMIVYAGSVPDTGMIEGAIVHARNVLLMQKFPMRETISFTFPFLA